MHYRGHRFRVRSALCFRRPRYCPVCLAESGYFKAVWDFSLAVFCPQHRCVLSCECTACATVLGWDRTALDWCRCGQPLASSTPLPVKRKEQLTLQTLFSNLLLGVSHKDETAQLGLPEWLVDLSLDGWFHLLSALGCADRSSSCEFDASARSEASFSRRIADSAQARWKTAHPNGRVIRRDLAVRPVPHIEDATIRGYYTPVAHMTPDLHAATALSDTLIAELKSAHTVLIASPIYNFSLPAQPPPAQPR